MANKRDVVHHVLSVDASSEPIMHGMHCWAMLSLLILVTGPGPGVMMGNNPKTYSHSLLFAGRRCL